MVTNFNDDRHALYCGWVIGTAKKYGLDPLPCVDERGNYLPHMEFTIPGGPTITVVIPSPPDGWNLTDD